jgi:nicotinamidase-related amidase
MKRLARMVERLEGQIDDIHITQDSHKMLDISHPMWWKDGSGAHPAPLTIITAADVNAGRWTTSQPWMIKRSLAYLTALEAGGRYPHVVWPYHCLIGDEGWNIHPALSAAVHGWEQARFAMPSMWAKGSNPWTEHFSAVKAEVPDPEDPSTQVDTRFIEALVTADVILLAGEALLYCVANTVRDVATEFGRLDPDTVKKLVLLTDATSTVAHPDGLFQTYSDAFIRELTGMGMRTATTTDFAR